MINILPNMRKTADSQRDFLAMTEGIEIGMGWISKGEMSNKQNVSLPIAARESGPKKLYGNFGKAAGSDDKDLCAVIWSRFDQTKAPVQVLRGGNHL